MVVLFIVLGGLLWLISLLLFAFSAWGFYKLARLLWEKIRRSFLRPGTAQVTSYEVFTPDPEDIHVTDSRPQVHLELDCERHGQRFQISLGPLTCEELFPALDLPAHHVACWLSEEDWQQLLDKRWITIACDWRQRKAILTSQIRNDRRLLLISFLSLSLFALLVTLSLLHR
ncbi:hypothetical protein [Comamonas sp.]|jgi:hypothetical protein|uniref:hypothetical protein n=1 Tax=Comamonas sp. TaxID=34028 RepID=UPI002648CA88|nr:hypothetical protein [Comamonas sp.]MDN5536127.1 hypothetical protein [Comamonas sp.]